MCVPLPICPFCGNHVLRLPCMVCMIRRIAELEARQRDIPMPNLIDFITPKETR